MRSFDRHICMAAILIGICGGALAQPMTIRKSELPFVFEKTEPGDILMKFDWVENEGRTIFEVFRMMPGSCMIGPLEFKDKDGKKMFVLSVGAEYPAGCRTAAAK